LPGNYTWWAVQYGRFLPHDAMLSAIHAVVVCLSVCLFVCVCLSHSGIVRKRINVVAEFLLTSASRGPSAIAEPLVLVTVGVLVWPFEYRHFRSDQLCV